MIITLSIFLFITDFWRVADFGARYARMDTGCMQQVATSDTVDALMQFLRSALAITMIYIASFCGPLGTGACIF